MNIPEGFEPHPGQGPFLEHVGPVYVREAEGASILGIRAEERHANQHGSAQGGFLCTFADFALGRAIQRDSEDEQTRVTASLTVDFLKPAKPGDWIEARTRVDRVGGTLAFADCTLVVDEKEVVRARAVFVVAGN